MSSVNDAVRRFGRPPPSFRLALRTAADNTEGRRSEDPLLCVLLSAQETGQCTCCGARPGGLSRAAREGRRHLPSPLLYARKTSPTPFRYDNTATSIGCHTILLVCKDHSPVPATESRDRAFGRRGTEWLSSRNTN